MRRIPLIVLMLALFVNLNFAYNNHLSPSDIDSVISLNSWEYHWGDIPITKKNLLNNKNQSKTYDWLPITLPAVPGNRMGEKWLWERVRIPSTEVESPSFLLRSIDQIFEVYMSGELIYSFGDLNSTNINPYIGYTGHMVELPDNSTGQWLYFRIYSEYSSIGIFSEVLYGPKDEIFKSVIMRELDSLITGSFFIFLGFLVLLLYIFGIAPKLKVETSSFLTFGFMQLVIGTMVISQLYIKSLIVYDPLLWMYIDLFSLFLIPIFVYAFYESILSSGLQKYVKSLWIAHSAFLFIILILDVFNLIELHQALIPFEYLMLFTASVMIITIIISLIKDNVEVRIFSVGALALVLFGTYDILGDMKVVYWIRSLLHLGMLIFTISLLIIIIRRFRDISGRLKVNERELEIARLVQKEVLPSAISLSQFTELEILVSYIPHTGNVSGDYYSISPLREGIASIAIADATGHGIQAALSTMQIDVLVRENKETRYPHEKLMNINKILTRDIGGKNFFTCFFLNIYSGFIEYSSAGHPAQFLYHANEKTLSYINTKGKPLGLVMDPGLEMKIEKVSNGDILILFSDGIFEEFNDKEEELGLEGLHAIVEKTLLNQKYSRNVQNLEQEIIEKICRFKKDTQFSDDITLIVIKIKDS